MRSLRHDLLFQVSAFRHVRGLYRRGYLKGRLSVTDTPSCDGPSAADDGTRCPALPDALGDALGRWHAAGLLPPLALVISRFRSMPAGAEAELFTDALAVVLREALGAPLPEPQARCWVNATVATHPLPGPVLDLVDAGHIGQATELTRAWAAGRPRREQQGILDRLLAEVLSVDAPDALAAALWGLSPAAAGSILHDTLSAELPELEDRVQAGEHRRGAVVRDLLVQARAVMGEGSLSRAEATVVLRAVYAAGYATDEHTALQQRVTDNLRAVLLGRWGVV